MSWRNVRLQFDIPSGWHCRDDVEPLTFESPSGLRLRVTPMHVPSALGLEADAEALLAWAVSKTRQSLGRPVECSFTACRFGRCAEFALPEDGRSRFWLLASPFHVLLVSSRGPASTADRERAQACVASMRLVAAEPFPN